MRKILRTQAARDVANRLIPAETAVDEALAKVAELTSAMVKARLSANLSASCGQEAMIRVQSVSALLFEARSGMLDAHASLAETQRQIGLREVSYGDLMGCPKGEAGTGENVVSIAA
jgi:hypothetical protein